MHSVLGLDRQYVQYANSVNTFGSAVRRAWTNSTTENITTIKVRSLNKKRVALVLNSILDSYACEHDPLAAWRKGCEVADMENDKIKEGLPADEPPQCLLEVNDDHFHVCIGCLGQTRCDLLSAPATTQYRACHSCVRKEVGLTVQVLPQKHRKHRYSVQQRLRILIVRDEKGNGLNLSSTDIDARVEAIMSELAAHKFSDGVWRDAYAHQDLREDVERHKTYTGSLASSFAPSVDAIFPFQVDPRTNKTGYHLPGIVVVTSDSLNRFCLHHPKIVLKAAYQYRNAASRDDYEQAIVLFWNLLVNGYLTGNSAAVRKNKTPPSNMSELQSVWMTGNMVSKHRPSKKKILAYHESSPRKIVDAAPWRPNGHEYLVEQLELTAQKYGLHEGDHRKLWTRIDQNDPGKSEVFYPFSKSMLSSSQSYEVLSWPIHKQS